MLKLFHSPGACSLVPHVALEEAGTDFEAVRVTLAQGEHLKPEYLAINPHARVPALATNRGTITENIAIVNYIADRFGAAGSVPRGDEFTAAKCNELLGWFSSTVHIGFAQVWRPGRFTRNENLHQPIIDGGRENLIQHFAEIEGMAGDGWLAGSHFSAADSYALTFFRWGNRIGFDMKNYPKWAALNRRLLDQPSVRRAIEKEGLATAEFQPVA